MMGERDDDCAQTGDGDDDPHLNYIRSSRITFRTGGRGEETEARQKRRTKKRLASPAEESILGRRKRGGFVCSPEIISSSSLGE